MNRTIATCSLCLCLLFPLSAWSESVVSTWRHKNGTTMILAMRDTNHVRMDTGKDRYILFDGTKVYMVSHQDGKWTAMDMDVLAGMMNQFGIRAGTKAPKQKDYTLVFRNTGRIETIAGYRGTVYVSETKDNDGQLIDSSEVVFSKHEDVKLASSAWISVASRMGDIIGMQTSQEIEQATKKAKASGYGGMLRVGALNLVSIKKPSLDIAYFELPEGTEIVDMDTMSGQGSKKSDTPDETKIVRELNEKASSAEQEETGQTDIDDVRKEVDGFFKKIFK